MTSFELDIIDEKSRAGSEFMARVIDEIRHAVASEKSSRKLTQQAIADKIGTSRAVINRQVQGLENLSARRIGEILWAIGWEPHFEARKIPAGENLHAPVILERDQPVQAITDYSFSDEEEPPIANGSQFELEAAA
jgi:hypothetical protein